MVAYESWPGAFETVNAQNLLALVSAVRAIIIVAGDRRSFISARLLKLPGLKFSLLACLSQNINRFTITIKS